MSEGKVCEMQRLGIWPEPEGTGDLPCQLVRDLEAEVIRLREKLEVAERELDKAQEKAGFWEWLMERWGHLFSDMLEIDKALDESLLLPSVQQQRNTTEVALERAKAVLREIRDGEYMIDSTAQDEARAFLAELEKEHQA